jgi:hypothetical protein
MKVYNVDERSIEERPITSIQGRFVWRVMGVGKPIVCHQCRKFINSYRSYVCYTERFFGDAGCYHESCVFDDDMADGFAELMMED